jgi:hypothetical protein
LLLYVPKTSLHFHYLLLRNGRWEWCELEPRFWMADAGKWCIKE